MNTMSLSWDEKRGVSENRWSCITFRVLRDVPSLENQMTPKTKSDVVSSTASGRRFTPRFLNLAGTEPCHSQSIFAPPCPLESAKTWAKRQLQSLMRVMTTVTP